MSRDVLRGSRRAVAPRDGDAGGTWVGVNDAGLTLGLANLYPPERVGEGGPVPGLVTRGRIIDALRRGRTISNVCFYNEREWRYVPLGVASIRSLARAEFLEVSLLQDANSAAWNMARLSFEPSDIRYIVVASEIEILPMIHEIERIKAKYSVDPIKVLVSRVASADQIRRDF